MSSGAPKQPSNGHPPTVIECGNSRFRLGVAPGLGGGVTHLAWLVQCSTEVRDTA